MDARNRLEYIAERFLPEIVAVILGLLAYMILHRGWYVFESDSKITDVFAAVVNVCAISVGFLGTVAALLISLDGRKAIEAIKGINLYGQLFGYIMRAVIWSFACAVITTVLILYQDITVPSLLHFTILALWTSLVTLSCVSSLLVVCIFSLILRKVADENRTS